MSTYRKKILEVDLSSGTVKTTNLDDGLLRKYIGGSGLAAKLFFDRVDPSVDPLGPDNPLIIMTGPLAGTPLPGSAVVPNPMSAYSGGMPLLRTCRNRLFQRHSSLTLF